MRDETTIVQLPVRKKGVPEGPLTVVHGYGGCQHRHFEVNERKAEVTCADCGEKLNPIWVLMLLATEDRVLRDRWAGMRAEVQLLGKRLRTKCRHCGQMTPVHCKATQEEVRQLAERIKDEGKDK